MYFSNKKGKKSTSDWKFYGKNVLIAIAIIIVIVISIIIWMRNYTHHGEEVEIPQITGLYVQEAEALLAGSDLTIDVIDSTYSRNVPLGTIVEQTPPAESHAKRGRTVYVVVNASAHRQVTLPEMHDISYRQAESMLKQLNLNISEVLYEPSEYRDLVLDIRQGETSLEAGSKLTEGSSVVLVIGQGKGTAIVTIPDIRGKKLTEVRGLLMEEHLTVGTIHYDEEVTEENKEQFMVYMQEPQSNSQVLEGTAVRLYLSLNPEKVVTADNQGDEEEFF